MTSNSFLAATVTGVGVGAFSLGYCLGQRQDRQALTSDAADVARAIRIREKLSVDSDVPVSDLVGFLRQRPMRPIGRQEPNPHSTARAIILCASGKGGVGKSTTAVNLSYMLNDFGLEVGLLDLDIYGPSLPELVKLPPTGAMQNSSGNLVPFEYGGVALMSWGWVQPGQAATIRAPIANEITTQLLTKVEWGSLDVLVVDTPPGTGDVLLSLSQTLAIDGAVLMTTANHLSLADVVKGTQLFEKVNIRTLAVAVNMSSLSCDACGHEHDLFSDGAASQLPQFLQANGVGLVRLPLDRDLSRAPSQPLPPLAMSYPYVRNPDYQNRPAWHAFGQLAQAVLKNLFNAGDQKPLRPGEAGAAQLQMRDNGLLQVRLKGGDLKPVECGQLRAMCKCAYCVDDMTGEVKIDRVRVLADKTLRAKSLEPVGNYAMRVAWRDGHTTLVANKTLEDMFAPELSVKKSDIW